VLAYEASQSSTTATGYFTAELNGDGELTWLDADTHFYRDTGLPLAVADALVRADDIYNNTPVYQNGLTALTSRVTVTSLSQAGGETDGSIHFGREHAIAVNMAASRFPFLVADFRWDPAEAQAIINNNDNFSLPTGFVNPNIEHADYRMTLSSNDMIFLVNGNTITVSPVPSPHRCLAVRKRRDRSDRLRASAKDPGFLTHCHVSPDRSENEPRLTPYRRLNVSQPWRRRPLTFNRHSSVLDRTCSRVCHHPMIHTLRILSLACCMAPTGFLSTAGAELQPHQVVILANAKRPESVAVATHYAARRAVPAGHIIRLDLPFRDNLTRREYEDLVVAPLRRTLETRNLASTARVIVTTYGIPLRIEAPLLSADENRWLAEAQSWVKSSRARLEQLENSFAKLAPGFPKLDGPAPNPAQEILEMARTMALLPRVDRAWSAAVEHTRRLPQLESEPALRELLRLTRQYGGWGLLLRQGMQANEPTEFAAWRNLLDQTGPLWAALGQSPISTQRPLIYRWAERLFGLRGVLELASAEVDLLTSTYADASLDSELSLLWWDRDLYPVAWRWSNPLFQDAVPNQDGLPVLMVSRLDAPTAELAKGLVDKALQAERAGLDGTVYFDARGLEPQDATDTYGVYDQSLRDAAEVVTQQSSYRVVLDNADATLSQPGAAPDVALYIGWYRLRSYEDAFVFKPGAIGYHMASAEAVTMHDRNERGWCKNALERGITATLGSVGEPYLDAFPEPAQFTRLLLTGRYSLAEIYYLTSRYVSWRMVLFGDPLYNPMRGRLPATVNEPIRLPAPPSERPLGDPPAQLDRKRREQRDRMAMLVNLLIEAEAADPQQRR
jgi:uncharacterized protein (TIGR03790 family)